MDIDTPGKDSYLLRKAGADQVIVASNQRWALMCETPDKPLNLKQLASHMDKSMLDLVLVEGFKDEPIAKIVLWRPGVKGEVEDLLDKHVIAVASDAELELPIASLDINQPEQIAEFIARWLASQGNT
jgi:molybdopterin-guanine dinucleotide biosynthesis protein B